MKKVTIIVGPARSGKTKRAKEIAESYKEDTVTFIHVGNRPIHDNPFFLEACVKQTKLIVFDDVPDVLTLFDVFVNVLAHGDKLQIFGDWKKPFFIQRPDIIITCHESIFREDVVSLGILLNASFQIIQIKKNRLINCNNVTL